MLDQVVYCWMIGGPVGLMRAEMRCPVMYGQDQTRYDPMQDPSDEAVERSVYEYTITQFRDSRGGWHPVYLGENVELESEAEFLELLLTTDVRPEKLLEWARREERRLPSWIMVGRRALAVRLEVAWCHFLKDLSRVVARNQWPKTGAVAAM